ncbi:MAG: ABC transporter ATP-binding protein [Bacteroidetes bacterium]|jgi:lipoprotein-releasing system ATP-binding protein|nr:ABC transporter ATP-binding protein [Bacteroidota bacterium]MBU1578496.1 ABC transporter ATP-binding protein [Bacteroidota bacterium]MBU2556452.1 ABC transporter ATP-binding protein [Bacteroidota bacterium]MDA3943921.1 ABC transporter ATP-binding protein [Bacteroidota bacterium]
MIAATGISKSFGKVNVLKQIDLLVSTGEIVSIVGPSGAGKSTLLQILGTIEQADSGSLKIDDMDMSQLNSKSLAAFRNQKIGFVFQFHHLFPEFTALENVCIPAFIAGKSRKQAEKEAHQLLDYLKLSDRADHKPAAMSGGEQQRVAVARALINKPVVVLADEPSGNLDTNSATELHKLFLDLRKQFNQTFVIVTHNPDLASMADRSFTLADGVWQ